MGRDRVSVLEDLAEVHAPGAVVIDGDWREVQPLWQRFDLADLGRAIGILLGLVFATIYSLAFLGSLVVFGFVIVVLLQ